MELRPYQLQNVEELRQGYRDGFRRQLLVSPTGSGKTVLFSFITKSAAARGLRVMILAHRAEILDQISRTLKEQSVLHASLRAGQVVPQGYQVMVASVQTLCRRLDACPAPDLIVVDEAHHSCAGSWSAVFGAFNTAKFLGVTATPERLDGKGLGDHYDRIVMGPRVGWLIQNGFLSPPVYYAPRQMVDVSKLRKTAGDYNKADAAALVDKPSITGSAVEHYKSICFGQRAIVFAISIDHAQHVASQFKSAGIPAECIDGQMGQEERKAILTRFANRETWVLCSCDLVSEGFDLPSVGAAVLLRPTASLALHLQQVGRSLRISQGKKCAYILDHVGNCIRHGLAEEDRDWSLEGNSSKRRKKDEALETKQCEKCFAIFAGRVCPQCGQERETKGREIETKEGSLKVLDAAAIEAIRKKTQEEQSARSLGDFIAIGKARGHKPGWAYFKWQNSWQRKRFGTKAQVAA